MLDDSTDRVTRELVDDKLMEWLEHGLDIEVMRRTNRAGYKAGALKEVYSLQTLDLTMQPVGSTRVCQCQKHVSCVE